MCIFFWRFMKHHNRGHPWGNIINTLKSMTTKRLGYSIWQDEFYDHIIRNQTDLEETRRYIVNNPLKRMNSNG